MYRSQASSSKDLRKDENKKQDIEIGFVELGM